MKHTFHDRLCAGLEAKGWKRDLTDRSRYDAYFHPQSVQNVRYFVGPNGALRQGECASRSHSVGDAVEPHTKIYRVFLDAGDTHLYLLRYGKEPEKQVAPVCTEAQAAVLRQQIATLEARLASIKSGEGSVALS